LDGQKPLVPAEYDVTALAEAFRERDFHLLRTLVGHRVEVGVELRHEALAVLLHNPRGFVASLVILKSSFRREPRHADVVAGLTVALGVAEIDDVDGMVSRALRRD
jgi:hypothetical protein